MPVAAMPVAAMLLAALLWSSTIIGSKLAVAELAVAEVVAWRFAFATAALWLVVLALRREFRLTRVSRRPLIMGLLDPGLVSLLMVWGLSQTSALNTAVFWALMPILMPVLGRVVLGEAIGIATMLGAGLAFAGSVLLVGANAVSGEGSLFGDLLGVTAVLCACVNALIARRVAQNRGDPMVTTAYQMAVAAGLAVAAAVLLGIGQPASAPVDGSSLGLLAYLGIAATAGPFLLYNYALQHMPVGQASLFASLVAPLAAPMAALLLGEDVTAVELLAVAIVLSGVALPFAAARRLRRT